MKHRLQLLASVAALTGLAWCHPTFAQTSAPSEITDAYQAIDQATSNRDDVAALRYYAPTVLILSGGNSGTISGSTLGMQLRKELQQAQSVDSKTTIDKTEVDPDGITITLHRTITETDISPSTGVLNTVVMHVTERNHWSKMPIGWRINRVRFMATSEMVNGERVTPSHSSSGIKTP